MRSDQSHRVRRSTGPRRGVALAAMVAAALAFGSTLPSTTALADSPAGSVRQALERLVREDRHPAVQGAGGPARSLTVSATDSATGRRGPADVPAVTGDGGSEPGLVASGRGDGDRRGSLRPWSLLKQLGVSLLRSWF